MSDEDLVPREKTSDVCTICGQQATKVVISNLGCWKLCARDSCWNRLTSRHPRTDLTWLSHPLDAPGDQSQ